MVGIAIFAVFVVLMLAGVPIGVALMLAGSVGIGLADLGWLSIPNNFYAGIAKYPLIDEILPVATEDAKEMARRLAREEALFAGTSSGANVVAAIQLAQRLGPGATVVTLMCDSGLKYVSTDVYGSR